MNGLFNGMFGKIAPGMCRLSMNGGMAIKTSMVIRPMSRYLADLQIATTLYLTSERNSSS